MTTITMADVHKAYGRTQALAGADLELRAGEIIGIAGPNGAGKSTLTKVLAGEETCDTGTFHVDGAAWDPRSGEEFVAVVHQEPQIWPNLTVLENLFVGRESGRLSAPSATARDYQVLADLALSPLAHTLVEHCTLAVRQRVEIGRAMVRDAGCYVFDEPNSALTEDESDALFRFMHGLADRGQIVVLISHRLAEMVAHCARVVVVRDGRVARTLDGDELTEEAIATELVVGHPPESEAEAARNVEASSADRSSLKLAGWRSEQGIFEVEDLQLRSGEVTAFVGVEGSGARELVASIAGFHPAHGTIQLGNAQDSIDVAKRSTFLSADRRGMLFHNLSVGDNLVARLGIPHVATRRLGRLRSSEIRRSADEAIGRFGVKTEGPEQPITALSGGNQQKVAIAAALIAEPSVLAIEEPTRGVDVGSKAGIYTTLRRAAGTGIVVGVFCTEVPEVFDLADRFLVVHRGRCILDGRTKEYAAVTELAEGIAIAEHTRPDDPGAGGPTSHDKEHE